MIEYIVIGKVNDGEEHARQLGRFVADELAAEVGEDDATPSSRRRRFADDDGGCLVLVLVLVLVFFRRVRAPGGYFVNLIPYNPTEIGATHGYATPSDDACERMREILTEEFGVKARVRWSTAKGREVDGACGQLALKSMRDAAEDLEREDTTRRAARRRGAGRILSVEVPHSAELHVQFHSRDAGTDTRAARVGDDSPHASHHLRRRALFPPHFMLDPPRVPARSPARSGFPQRALAPRLAPLGPQIWSITVAHAAALATTAFGCDTSNLLNVAPPASLMNAARMCSL